MVPVIDGSVSNPICTHEESPCIEEQTAYCVIDIAKKADSDTPFPGQDAIVQWQICHSQGTSLEECHAKVGIDGNDVKACLDDTARIQGLLRQYLNIGCPGSGVPTEKVNGNTVGSDYAEVKEAICSADPSLSACGGSSPTLTGDISVV